MDQAPQPLFNPQAADAPVLGMLQPPLAELPALLRSWSGPTPLRLSSGGTTSRAAAADCWSLRLSSSARTLCWNAAEGTVRIGAGCRMGDVLTELAEHQRTIPAGLSGLPGLGYVLTGGMGPLSRRWGLAVDQLKSITGIWGCGEPFQLERSDHGQSPDWRGLCGAAPFLAVVTEVELFTQALQPLWVRQLSGAPQQLGDWIEAAEHADAGSSLQWHWGVTDRLSGLAVRDQPALHHHSIDGLHQLPPLASPPPSAPRLHAEVVGLLGPADAAGWRRLLPELQRLMDHRPHEACSLSAQQLGEATSHVQVRATSFIHRDAVWKPWITAVWRAGDAEQRQRSLVWLQEVWQLLRPVCPGVHLAQLHDHLPFHRLELEQAFGSWLPGLRELKRQRDPRGMLPPL